METNDKKGMARREFLKRPVSYTHLTLPTTLGV